PGAVDRLRSFRSLDDGGGSDAEGTILTLSVVDPAQPYGAALRWPQSGGRPSRSAGAHLLLADGEPLVFLERGGHAVSLFSGAATRPDWPVGLLHLLDRRRYRSIEIRTADGLPVREVPEVADALRAHGWQDAYKGLVRRTS
ncbi:MAG: hypothetical protein H0W25_20120, partial [Acidimicrobiia bacterium]|nr:hypothetical protein [Acidimicrobiia bacterium]